MKQISAGEAQLGDVIAEPVANAEGRILLPKGSKLSAAVLSRLDGWGVTKLTVEGDDPDGEEEPANSLLDDLDHRFSAWDGDDLMMEIKDLARSHLVRARLDKT